MIYYGPHKLTKLILREDQQHYGASYSPGSWPFARFLPILLESFYRNTYIIANSQWLKQWHQSPGKPDEQVLNNLYKHTDHSFVAAEN